MTNLFFRFMKILLFLLTCSTLCHAATRAPDYPTALAQKTDIAVLVIGSDWCRSGEPFAKAWDSDALATALPQDIVMLTIDRKELPTEADKSLAELNKNCPLPVRSLPALAYIDRDGRLIGIRSGKDELASPEVLIKTIQTFATIRIERDKVWKRADQVQGIKRAEALGAGLAIMNQGIGHKKVYQPIIAEITKADPQDLSGYAGKFSFPGHDLAPQILANFVATKKFAEGEAELLRWHRNPRLDNEQRQELHAARFALYRNWPEKNELARKALEDMRDANPQSELGKSAVNYLAALYPPLTLANGWTPSHLSASTTKWKIDATKIITEKGDYSMTFLYTKGADALVIHGARLLDRQGILANDDHEGSTGSQHKDNVYHFFLKRKPAGDVFLHTEVEAGKNHNSTGTFLLEKKAS